MAASDICPKCGLYWSQSINALGSHSCPQGAVDTVAVRMQIDHDRAEHAEAACKAAVDNAMELARERDAAQDEVARLRHNEKVLQDTIQEMARRNAKLEAVAEAARKARDASDLLQSASQEMNDAQEWPDEKMLRAMTIFREWQKHNRAFESALDALDAAKGGGDAR